MNTPSANMKTGHSQQHALFCPVLYTLTLFKDEDERTVELGFSAGRLLERLLQEPGQVIDRETLVAYAWSDRVVGPGSLNQQVYTLRKILGDEKNLQIIQTVPRRGYRLNPTFSIERSSLASATLQAPLVTGQAPEQPCAEPAQAPSGMRRRFMAVTAIAVAVAGYFFALPSPELYASMQKVGANTVMYVDQQEPQVQELIKTTRVISERMIHLSNQPVELAIVGSANGEYQIYCSLQSGRHHVLKLHRDDIQNISDARLRDCVN